MATGTRNGTRERRGTRDAILDAALTVIARGGLRASRMEDVAAEAGLSRQSVYYHFGSREEVLSALIDRGMADLATAIHDSLSSDNIDELVVAAVRFFAANQALCRLLITEMWGLAGDPHEPRRIIDRVEADIVGPVASRIAQANQTGQADCAEPTLAARALMGQATGVAFGPIVREEPLDVEPIEADLRAYTRAVLSSGGVEVDGERGTDGGGRPGAGRAAGGRRP